MPGPKRITTAIALFVAEWCDVEEADAGTKRISRDDAGLAAR